MGKKSRVVGGNFTNFGGGGPMALAITRGECFTSCIECSFISLFVADRCLILVCLIMAGTPSCLYSLISVLVFVDNVG